MEKVRKSYGGESDGLLRVNLSGETPCVVIPQGGEDGLDNPGGGYEHGCAGTCGQRRQGGQIVGGFVRSGEYERVYGRSQLVMPLLYIV